MAKQSTTPPAGGGGRARSRLLGALALAAGIAALAAGPVGAQDQAQDDQPKDTAAAKPAAKKPQAKKLEAITVTGSLIPQSQVETATPVITITADDMKARGFATVADALQQSSFATGGVQGAQFSAGFTPGAQTLSMFGMPVGFTKYLIDGRPMGSFPALYNGSDTFNNLSGIPIQMVDHIDILPGGQSSLYGSDAISGVINIVLKKKLDAPVLDVRYGFDQGGGGASRRISLADSFHFGRFNVLAGVQYEKDDPVWGYDRRLTEQYYRGGTSPAVASRDYLVNSGTTGAYLFEDPNNCANVTGQFAGTEGRQHRANSGDYCGSVYTPGYATYANGSENAQLYTHATFDASDSVQLYGDLLYNYDETRYTSGPSYTWWGTSVDYGYIYDPRLDDFVNLQRAFAPEDIGAGGYKSIMNKDVENAYMLTLGAKGSLGENWDWDLGFTHSDDKLIQRDFARWAGPMDAYFERNVLGPDLGPDPYGFGYETYQPNYAAFYTPMSPADFASFTGYTTSHSKTWDNMLRGQLTNASLFALPGGDAGVAVVLEGGNQGWSYQPDARLLDGEVWGTSAVQGAGHRSRYAGTVEFRAPLFSMLTLDASGRYDNYKVAGKNVDKATYNLGLEFRPFDTLLLRAKYGTAFKAPTLSDQFQGLSGYYSFVTDYYNCAVLGYRGGNVANCPSQYSDRQYFGQQSGNAGLKPLTAKVWSYGFVWSPLERLSLSVDYLYWRIKGEVQTQSADTLANQDMLCRLGQYDINSATCQAAESQITREAGVNTDGTIGGIDSIYTSKINASKETVASLIADARYAVGIGHYGRLSFDLSYTDMLKHDYKQFAGDTSVNLLTDPTWSTDFKSKANASLTWDVGRWSSTLYVSRYGSTPNYIATQNGYDYPGAGRLRPWIRYNGSVSYSPADNFQLSLMVNNIFNKMPPPDRSYPGTTGQPYNTDNYDVYGRVYYLQATYKFGKAG
jgi:outer membrane receptor protein involved in Fe transport